MSNIYIFESETYKYDWNVYQFDCETFLYTWPYFRQLHRSIEYKYIRQVIYFFLKKVSVITFLQQLYM